MRIRFFLISCFLLVSAGAYAETTNKHYKVVNEDGTIFYGDSVPPEYTDYEKEVVNDHAVTIDRIEGRKTEEELAAEREAEKQRVQEQLQLRADKALLATYLTVDEIRMHRDRRIELFQAQSRVTQLYLRNLQRRLEKLEREATRFAPYSSDPDAEIIDPDLVADINQTKSTIERHERNLQKFRNEEEVIMARFDGDIDRFKSLKGLE
ncbi:MAG: hypothetical protein KJO82_16035 [Gammaproteobacteria bacterium]|nr:hypothetical protein [Gammaproteobacteria bacterium]NNC78029.1 hypothetical protein [Woeseiaceae bacterium]